MMKVALFIPLRHADSLPAVRNRTHKRQEVRISTCHHVHHVHHVQQAYTLPQASRCSKHTGLCTSLHFSRTQAFLTYA